MKRVEAIARKSLRMILEASRDMYPQEFGAVLRADEGTIDELLVVPGTISGKHHAIFQLHTLPTDFAVVGPVRPSSGAPRDPRGAVGSFPQGPSDSSDPRGVRPGRPRSSPAPLGCPRR